MIKNKQIVKMRAKGIKFRQIIYPQKFEKKKKGKEEKTKIKFKFQNVEYY